MRARRSNGDDPRVAAAALLTHIMDADGERTAGEREMLKRLLSENYDLRGEELDKVMAAEVTKARQNSSTSCGSKGGSPRIFWPGKSTS